MNESKFVNFDPYKRTESEDPICATELFKQIYERYDIDPNNPITILNSQWNILAGNVLGTNTACLSIKDGSLLVGCKSGADAQNMKFQSIEILKKINATYPEFDIKRIKAVVYKH